MRKAFTLLLAAFALAGCTQTTRFVTARTWLGDDTLYVAYTQWDKGFMTSSYTAKVLRCNRQPDNGLQCVDEEQLNQLLNEGSATK
jgi:hypothetical protein